MALKQLSRRSNLYDLSSARIALIPNASDFYDIEKISISEDVLNKPGTLTPKKLKPLNPTMPLVHKCWKALPITGTKHWFRRRGIVVVGIMNATADMDIRVD